MRDQDITSQVDQRREWDINKQDRMIVVRTLVDQQLTTGKVIIVDDPINEEGVNYLIERATPTLLTLILKGAFSGSAALLSFHRGVFNNLVIVELKNNEIDNQGCKHLSKCSFNSMRKLSLASNSLDSGGVMHLQKAKWRTVLNFSLYNNNIGVMGTKLIGKCQFSWLESLAISKCIVNINGLFTLLGFQYSLKRLYMSISRDEYFEVVKIIDSAIEQKFPKLVDSNFT